MQRLYFMFFNLVFFISTSVARICDEPSFKNPDILADDLASHVRFLSSDELEGRRTGTNGEILATRYVADALSCSGLKPFDNSFFDYFEFIKGISLGEHNKLIITDSGKEFSFSLNTDFRPISYSANGFIEPTQVVFAGYGIVAPKNQKFPSYNSYEGLDAKGKWVIIFRFLPENIDKNYKSNLVKYADLRKKISFAREKGAIGVIIASGVFDDSKLIDLTFEPHIGESSVFAISVTNELFLKIVKLSKDELMSLKNSLDSGEIINFKVNSVKISAQVELLKEIGKGRNVLAMIESSNSDSFLSLGAHVDHLGKLNDGSVFHGADDNASGVAALIEIAGFLANQVKMHKFLPNKSILFAAWSGEEIGSIGSTNFIKKREKLKITSYLNMDMIGRFKDKLIIQGVGSSSYWPSFIERMNHDYCIPLLTVDDPYLPTDSTPFYIFGIPILNFFTGSHSDYHTIHDTFDKLNYESMEIISKFIANSMIELATDEKFPDYKKVSEHSSQSSLIRVYLGTIPDFSIQVKGVPIMGLRPNSPAERAGIVKGDIIVELSGIKIENIYDYADVLAILKVGEEVSIVVNRNGNLLTLKIVPEAKV